MNLNEWIFLIKERYEWMNNFIKQDDIGLEVGAGPGLSKEFIRNNNLKIRDANFKYYFSKNENKGVLKGKFLGESIYFSFEENKVEKNASTIFLLKLPKHKLFA